MAILQIDNFIKLTKNRIITYNLLYIIWVNLRKLKEQNRR